MITSLMVYLEIGAVIWAFLDGTGIIDNSYAARHAASKRAQVLATLYMIAGWPLFVWAWARGMRS